MYQVTLGILHYNHQRFIFQKVFIVLNDVWMAQHGQDSNLSESCLSLFFCHLFYWNLLYYNVFLVTESKTEVNGAVNERRIVWIKQ